MRRVETNPIEHKGWLVIQQGVVTIAPELVNVDVVIVNLTCDNQMIFSYLDRTREYDSSGEKFGIEVERCSSETLMNKKQGQEMQH